MVSVVVVLVAAVALGGVFAFARPRYHPDVMPSPPDDGLSYSKVAYTRADVVEAFATRGIHLIRGATLPGMKDAYSRDLVVEATVFGDRKTVDAAGFSDYSTLKNGKWSLAPKNCIAGANNAERWRGNVRVIVSCSRAGTASASWLQRVAHSLADL